MIYQCGEKLGLYIPVMILDLFAYSYLSIAF